MKPKGPVKNDPIDQSGTTGFSPQYGGNGKVGVSNTSGFDAGPPKYTLPGLPSGDRTAPVKDARGGQDEGRMRQPTTSVAGRVK